MEEQAELIRVSWAFLFAHLVLLLSLNVHKEGTTVLENLVSSRIRRTLLEHVLQHPQDRFYLRGLAKELSLSITPLRRELKRLEQAGVLQAIPEGNMLFYTVNTASPVFTQLQRAGGQMLELPIPTPAIASTAPVFQPAAPIGPAVVSSAPIEIGMTAVSVATTPQRAPKPFLLRVVSASVALVCAAVGLSYMIGRHSQPDTRRNVATRQDTTVVAAQTSSSVMQGAHWRITPGGSGGFSASARSEPVSR